MSAFLTGQLQHQGCERGSSRPAALDLHRVERDLEGGGTSIGEGKGGRGGEDWRRGATEAATDVNGRRWEGEIDSPPDGRGLRRGSGSSRSCLGKVAWAVWWSLGLDFLSCSPFLF